MALGAAPLSIGGLCRLMEAFMCVDTPDNIRLKIAGCACGALFPDCDLEDACNHITYRSSPSHRWVQLHPKYREVIEEHTFINKLRDVPQ